MLAHGFGELLRGARKHRGLTRVALAERGGVSVRLIAELEQGKRPNVSFESALKLLSAVGVSVIASAPHGEVLEIKDRSAAAAAEARAERAMQRRITWTGRTVPLHAVNDEPRPARSKSKRFAAI
jgi:transcriptional regulator with XRE-family HTH domain